MSTEGPHGWSINVTCPRCGNVGDAHTTFPCCEHVEQLRAQVKQPEEERERWKLIADATVLNNTMLRQEPASGDYLHAMAENQRLRAKLMRAREFLCELWDEGWLQHGDDDCPLDDTCSCENMKRFSSIVDGEP